MDAFEFDVDIQAAPSRVMAAFWELDNWPSVAPHVRRVDLHYRDENVQVLTMDVASRGQVHGFKSVRIKRGDTIAYWQPEPPPLLLRHEGSWRFVATDTGTLVTSRHAIVINDEVTARLFDDPGADTVSRARRAERVRDLIRQNSLQTMLALKQRLEARVREGAGDESDHAGLQVAR